MPLSHTERIARSLIAHYHPELKQTHGYRPDWLKNPATGKNLEIDIWFADLQAGIEVQGVQHGRPIDGLQKDFAAFEKQQRHDALKNQRCAEFSVRLYHLTIHDLTERRWESFLKRFEQENRLLPNRYSSRPAELFAEAEKLSRRKVVRTPYLDEWVRIIPAKRSGWGGFVDWLKS